MKTCRFASLVSCLILGLATSVCADPPVPDSGPFASGDVIQAVGSGTVASRVLQKVSFEAPKNQIKFEMRVIRVDADIRDQIYAVVGTKNVQTQITNVDDFSKSLDANDVDPVLASRHTIATGSIVSTVVLSESQVKSIFALADQDGLFKVVATPTIIAADGQTAGIQNQVQRPFLAKINEIEHEGQVAVETGIQVLSDGTDLTVQGNVDGDALSVRIRLQQTKVAEVRQQVVYGIGEGQNTIQVPSHEVRVATAVGRLLPKQTLLLDPYIESVDLSVSKTVNPILSKIPAVKEMFETIELKDVTVNTIILVSATKLK